MACRRIDIEGRRIQSAWNTKKEKRAGRHGGYTRMTFGIIDDVTDASGEYGAVVGLERERRRRPKPPMVEPDKKHRNKQASLCEQQVFPIKNLNKFNFYRQILVYSKFL